MKNVALWVSCSSALLALAVVVCLISQKARLVRGFCTGEPADEVKRLEIEGQGLRASVSDKALLNYFLQEKLVRLPAEREFSRAVTFKAYVVGRWGVKGECTMMVGSDTNVIQFSFSESFWFDSPRYSYLEVHPAAPPDLRELLGFLLTETNRGREWRK